MFFYFPKCINKQWNCNNNPEEIFVKAKGKNAPTDQKTKTDLMTDWQTPPVTAKVAHCRCPET